MQHLDTIGMDQFLTNYPTMAIRPSSGVYLRLKGAFRFSVDHPQFGLVTDSFLLQIDIPRGFPRELPDVTEIGGRIPRLGQFHINGNGTLCLGSHLRLLLKLREAPTLAGYTDRCLVPYLYAISRKLTHGGKLVFGELDHYGLGMLKDYAQLFGLPTIDQAKRALELLGMKKRIANRQPCPCGCKLRLGSCQFNHRLLPLRKLACRGWFKKQLKLAAQ
jgi:hypothetical protein